MDPPTEGSFHFFALGQFHLLSQLVLNCLSVLGCFGWVGIGCCCFEDCFFVSRLVTHPQHMSLGNFSASLLISDLIFIL